MKKFMAANQKGGVGKTNTNCHKAHFLADTGERALIVNFDEQEGTNHFMAAYALPGIFTHQLFGEQPLVLPHEPGKLALIASDREHLREIEESRVDDYTLVANLRARLAELEPFFDYAVFDTAGANSRIANACLVVSDFVTVPTKIDEESISESVETVGRIGGIRNHPDARLRNAGLVFLGLLVNEYDPRQPFQVQQFNKMKAEHGDLMVPYPITDRQAYREAAAARIPVWRLRSEEGGPVKTAAREAGKEIALAFTHFKRIMQGAEVAQ
jgi:chromosome partitioning protein